MAFWYILSTFCLKKLLVLKIIVFQVMQSKSLLSIFLLVRPLSVSLHIDLTFNQDWHPQRNLNAHIFKANACFHNKFGRNKHKWHNIMCILAYRHINWEFERQINMLWQWLKYEENIDTCITLKRDFDRIPRNANI